METKTTTEIGMNKHGNKYAGVAWAVEYTFNGNARRYMVWSYTEAKEASDVLGHFGATGIRILENA